MTGGIHRHRAVLWRRSDTAAQAREDPELVDGQQDQADAVAAAKRLDEILASVSAERIILTSAVHPTGH